MRNNWRPYLLLTLTVLFWSGNFVLGRGIRDMIPPASLNFWRWTGALLILLPFGLPHLLAQRRLVLHHWRLIVLLSIPSITFFNMFIYQAVQTTTAMNTVLVNAMVPIFIVVMARVFFNDRLAIRQTVGILVSLGGLTFIITRGEPGLLRSLHFSVGDLWTLGAGLSWAFYSVMLRRRPADLHPLAFLTALVIAGLVFLTPIYLWEWSQLGGFQLTGPALASITYVCIFPSVLSYIFWNRGVQAVGASRAGIFIHLMPVFATILAVLFLGEAPAVYHVAGIALIFFGIGMTTWPVRR